MHSIPSSFSKPSGSRFWQTSIMRTGTRNSGHALTQRPQRMQGVSGFSSTASRERQVRAELVFVVVALRSYMAKPIIGPPLMTFFGSVLNPPASAMSSLQLMPMR